MSLLSIKNMSVTYSPKAAAVRAVDNVSLEIQEKTSWGIVGESGSGKTTLVSALMRLIPENRAAVTGEAVLDGVNILALPDKELRAIRWVQMSMVFQKSMNAFSPVHRVGAFMQDIYHVHKPEVSRASGRKRVEELLELVNLPKRVYTLYPHELSGGMMQRASIALSLLFNPKLLILDEATTALDVVTQSQVLKEIEELEHRMGIARIMITHDISVVASSCENVAVLYAGRLLEAGKVDDVLVTPKHPYTQGLLESFPDENDKNEPLHSIGGSMPDLSNLPAGCVFAPRCKYKKPICESKRPVPTFEPNGRMVCCHLVGGDES